MIAKLAIAATAATLLAACAANPPAAASVAANGGKGTYYCWKERLTTEGDGLVCNWETSASDACRSTSVVTLRKGTIASGPRDSRLCDNGQWLVAVTTR